MVAMPLAHVSWAIADNADRAACDAFFLDIFGAQTAYEILVSPETAAMGMDREERLMVIGDTMLIPIAPAGAGVSPDSPTGEMLRRSAGANRWLGVALRVAHLPDAATWFTARGFKLHYDPGMESHYFLLGRKQALGMRVEIMQGELPNDPRLTADWNPLHWRDDHPLGIEGLQSVGISVPSLEQARDVFAGRFDWPEISTRALPEESATCAAFLMGDTVIEALEATDDDSPVARHCRDVQGIYALTFKVASATAAADYLRGRGLALIGNTETRFAIDPAQAFGRLIWFTGQDQPGYPRPASLLRSPAQFTQ